MERNKRVRVAAKISAATYLLLGKTAALNKEPVAAFMRRLLAESLDDNPIEANPLTLAVRGSIKNTLKPVEEALAKHAVEAALAAATGMYLGVQAAHDLGAKDVVEMHHKACEMAVDYVGGRKDLPI